MEEKLKKAVESSKRHISESRKLIEKSRAIIIENQTVKTTTKETADKESTESLNIHPTQP